MSVRAFATTADIDVGAELGRLEALGGGGVASFTGIVRGGDGLVALHLDTYPAMIAPALEAIAGEAMARWSLLGATLIHRYGTLAVGERIVLVAAAAPRRVAALEACAFLIDWAKTKAPFWKQERFADGHTLWVEALTADDVAASRWDR